MPFFSFADGAAMFDSTPIENMFLMEYLPIAPEEYLRVYLYARMLSLHPELGGDLPGMAAALRMDEDSVYSAFAYWEQQGLVRRLTDRPPTYELLPVRAESLTVSNPMERDYYKYRDFNASLQGLFGAKLVQPREYRIANDWLNVLGYDQDAALRLVEYGIRRSRSKSPEPSRVFNKRMEKLAAVWAERGCRTVEDVERAIAMEEGAYPVAQAVLKRLAMRREPTLDELDCARRWLDEWHLTQDQILEACEETTKSRTPSFAYLDAILKSRLEGNAPLREELVAALRELDAANAQPTPDQLARYAALKAAGFEAETVRLAAVQCHRKRKTCFEDLEWMLNKWRELNLFTPEAAAAYVQSMRQKTVRVRRILERAGLERRPTMDDLELYDAWSAAHGDDVIDYAAQCARGMRVPVRYIDKLLAEWRKAGIATLEAAQAAHAENGARVSGSAGNPALDYAQREYADEDFGEDFFFDAVKEYGNGGKEK